MKSQQKRATIYLEATLHKALRVKAVETDSTISKIVGQAVRRSLAEDAEDIAAFRLRAHEPDLPLENVLKDLKRRGLL
ncbi:MAG: CopG family transcriptional regulator [Acidobacteria bacterium RIFCSPLOWO2_12_FULL_54_10]|nr:MAG: CopG family transcriptional regulator [Acidobacteria bacterium RIFCSPLOWO2_12_FULL_54_10]